jgi:hypothetical protein
MPAPDQQRGRAGLIDPASSRLLFTDYSLASSPAAPTPTCMTPTTRTDRVVQLFSAEGAG